MIRDIYLKSDVNEYWKISNFFDLREKIEKTHNIPVNPSMLKKIIISLVTTIASSILLPNLLTYFQTLF